MHFSVLHTCRHLLRYGVLGMGSRGTVQYNVARCWGVWLSKTLVSVIYGHFETYTNEASVAGFTD